MNTIQGFLNVNWGRFKFEQEILIQTTGVTSIVGKSGCGKTTLLRWIAGLEQGNPGFLKVNGKIWEDSAKKIFVPTYKRAVGFVFQENSFFYHLSVYNNLRFAMKRVPGGISTEQFTHITKLLEIEPLLGLFPADLSGGQSQRVALARSLLVSPEILLLDEPLSALDKGARQQILHLVKLIKNEKKIPILFVSHSEEEVAELSDYIFLVNGGDFREQNVK